MPLPALSRTPQPVDWGQHFRDVSRRPMPRALPRALPQDGRSLRRLDTQKYPSIGGAFGAEMANPVFGMDTSTSQAIQNKLNASGFGPLNVDGIWGPASDAALKKFQAAHGLTVDGIPGPATLGAMGIPMPAPHPTQSTVNISTVIAALRQAAQEKGYTLSDTLASLMVGQLRGAEGAYPGVGGTLGGTNNMGAAQVTASFASAKKGLKGWGAFAHYDSDPNRGGYIGWYWMAPTPLDAARQWLNATNDPHGNWWGTALLKANPTNPTDYAAILYRGGYFQGMHPGDTNKDPNSDAGKLNVADYARAVQRGMASPGELSAAPSIDPSKTTLNPKAFESLSARKITPDLYAKAISGGPGAAWKFLLPPTWEDLQSSNGVVWFGPAVGALLTINKLIAWGFGGMTAIGLIILGVRSAQGKSF